MKSLIIIICLLVSTEIQFTLSKDHQAQPKKDIQTCNKQKHTTELKTNEDSEIIVQSFDELENAAESVKIDGVGVKDDLDTESVPHNRQRMSSNNPSLDYSTTITSVEVEKNAEETPTNVEDTEKLSIEDMKKTAAANRDSAIKKAKLALQKVKTEIETLKRKSDEEFNNDIEKSLGLYKKAESTVTALGKKLSNKMTRTRDKILAEYDQTVTAAEKKLRNAREAYNAAYQTAYDKLDTAERQFEENKQKIESDNREALEEVRKKKETVQKLAEERKEKAYVKYQKAMETNMLPNEKAKAKAEYQKETCNYEEALEMADEEYKQALDSLGLNEAALEEAVKQFELAEERAESMLTSAIEEHDRALEEAKIKRHEAEQQAKAERAKEEERYDKYLDNAENQHNVRAKKLYRRWKKVQKQANEELSKANAEFYITKKQLKNQYITDLEIIERKEKEMAKLAKAESIKLEKQFRANSKNPAARRQMQDRYQDASNCPSKRSQSPPKRTLSLTNSGGGGGGSSGGGGSGGGGSQGWSR